MALIFLYSKSKRRKMKYEKLKARIKTWYGSEATFARALGVHRATVSYHLRKKKPFSGQTVKKWAEALTISPDEIGEYFFEDGKEKP